MRKPKLNAQSTTFGIKMGDPPRKFGGKITKGSDFVYKCEKVPRPHPNMEKYYVWSYPETGIAWIESVGFKHQNDSYGKSIRIEMDRIAKQITSKYGQWNDHVDSILPNSYFTEAQDWSESVSANQRSYSYSWKITHHGALQSILRTQMIGIHILQSFLSSPRNQSLIL
ncbi:MAG: hypothetical protein OXF08_08450 [Bacteroidetes bacterium]|nr:hypothetical protein [Bacteroidota bacterium]